MKIELSKLKPHEYKKCPCCNIRRIIGNQKHCSSCAVYIKDLQSKMRYYQNKYHSFQRLIYGRIGNKHLGLPNELRNNFSPMVKLAYQKGRESNE